MKQDESPLPKLEESLCNHRYQVIHELFINKFPLLQGKIKTRLFNGIEFGLEH